MQENQEGAVVAKRFEMISKRKIEHNSQNYPVKTRNFSTEARFHLLFEAGKQVYKRPNA